MARSRDTCFVVLDLMRLSQLLLTMSSSGQEVGLPEYVVSECYGDIFNFDCGPGNKIRVNRDFFGYSSERDCRYHHGDCIISNPKSNSLIHRFCTGHRVCTYYMVERRGCGGFFSNYQQVEYQCIPDTSVTDVCSTVEYEAESTYIASPNFPENYPPNLDCKCVVQSASPDAKVQMEIVYVAIKYTHPCKDWLGIGRRKTCGTTVELFQGGSIPIEFHSDGDDSHSGFWLHFQSSRPGEKVIVRCGNVTDSTESPTQTTTTATTTSGTTTTTSSIGTPLPDSVMTSPRSEFDDDVYAGNPSIDDMPSVGISISGKISYDDSRGFPDNEDLTNDDNTELEVSEPINSISSKDVADGIDEVPFDDTSDIEPPSSSPSSIRRETSRPITTIVPAYDTSTSDNDAPDISSVIDSDNIVDNRRISTNAPPIVPIDDADNAVPEGDDLYYDADDPDSTIRDLDVYNTGEDGERPGKYGGAGITVNGVDTNPRSNPGVTLIPDIADRRERTKPVIQTTVPSLILHPVSRQDSNQPSLYPNLNMKGTTALVAFTSTMFPKLDLFTPPTRDDGMVDDISFNDYIDRGVNDGWHGRDVLPGGDLDKREGEQGSVPGEQGDGEPNSADAIGDGVEGGEAKDGSILQGTTKGSEDIASEDEETGMITIGLIILCVSIGVGIFLVCLVLLILYCRRTGTRDDETQTNGISKHTTSTSISDLDGDSGQGLLVAQHLQHNEGVVLDVDALYAKPIKSDKSLQIDIDDEYDDVIIGDPKLVRRPEFVTLESDSDDASLYYGTCPAASNNKAVQVTARARKKVIRHLPPPPPIKPKPRPLPKARIRRLERSLSSGIGLDEDDDDDEDDGWESSSESSDTAARSALCKITDSDLDDFTCSEVETVSARHMSLRSMSELSEVTMMPQSTVDSLESKGQDWDQQSGISI